MELVREMTSGERAAYQQGKEVTTPEQMAVCYLCAEASVNDRDVRFGPGIGSDIAMECGMSPETFRRTCNKLALIMQDRHEDDEFTGSEIVYPKIVKYHAAFAEMKRDEVMAQAQLAFNEENRIMGEHFRDAAIAKTQKYSQQAKAINEQLKFKLIDLFNSLKRAGFSPEKAKTMAISKLATESKKDKSEIQRIWSIAMK